MKATVEKVLEMAGETLESMVDAGWEQYTTTLYIKTDGDRIVKAWTTYDTGNSGYFAPEDGTEITEIWCTRGGNSGIMGDDCVDAKGKDITCDCPQCPMWDECEAYTGQMMAIESEIETAIDGMFV